MRRQSADVAPDLIGTGIDHDTLKPYAKVMKSPRSSLKNQFYSESESETCDESTLDDGDSATRDLFTSLLLADTRYKEEVFVRNGLRIRGGT